MVHESGRGSNELNNQEVEALFSWDELRLATSEFLKMPLIGDKPSDLSLKYRISTDTRRVQAGDFYLALSGARFDGHNFLEQAFKQGACGAFVSEDWIKEHPQVGFKGYEQNPLIVVKDTVEAYLALGRFHRRRMGAKIVALTGSSGKTTTKEMLYAGLSPLLPTQCTQKNFNNEIGVSQTLLSIQPETQLMIVEMGMRGPGEIALLSRYAEPDVALVINVGSAHIGRLGSLKKIAQAKCEIFEGLTPASGIAILNKDDGLLMETFEESGFPSVLDGQGYSLSEAENKIDAEAGKVRFTYHGQPIELSTPGDYMVSNALAVLKVGEALGFSVKSVAKGLARFQSAEGRGEISELAGFNHVRVVNDAYNSNPESLRASLGAFLKSILPNQKRFLILGGMKELDAQAQAHHEALGRWLTEQKGIDALFLVGEEMTWVLSEFERSETQKSGENSRSYPVEILTGTPTEMAKSLVESLQASGLALEHCCLYLKGSRAYSLERLPEALLTVLKPV